MIAKAIKELNGSLMRIAVFDSFLNGVILFLTGYILLTATGLLPFPEDRAIYAALIAIAGFCAWTVWKARKNRVRMVERKFSFLNEKLGTAADNVGADNEVVRALNDEVLVELKDVYEGAFFSDRGTYGKTVAIIALCFMLLLAPAVMGKVLNLNIIKEKTGKAVLGADSSDQPNYVTGGPGGAGSFDVETEPGGKIVALSTRQLNVSIRQAGYKVNLKNAGEAEERNFYESYPREVSAPNSVEPFAENIPTEQEELVKKYFENLAK